MATGHLHPDVPASRRCSTCGATPGHACRATGPGEPVPDGPHPARVARAATGADA